MVPESRIEQAKRRKMWPSSSTSMRWPNLVRVRVRVRVRGRVRVWGRVSSAHTCLSDCARSPCGPLYLVRVRVRVRVRC